MAEITDQELATLHTQIEAGETAAAALEKSQEDLATADTLASATRAALLTTTRSANPTIPEHLIDGDTPEAIEASVAQAKTTVEQVLEANKPDDKPKPRTTGAAPPRGDAQPPDNLRGVSKISWGLTHESAPPPKE